MLGNIREIFQNMICIKFLPKFLPTCKVFLGGFESMFCYREYKLIRNKNRWQAFLSFLWIAHQAFLSFLWIAHIDLFEVALSMLGKNFSRQHSEIFFLFFPENRHFYSS